MSSPYFSILADECEDVATCVELSICCRWLVGGKPEEHFMTILHAATITEALSSFILDKQLDYQKLVGQAYDGAAVWVFKPECMSTLLMHSIFTVPVTGYN